MARAFIDLVQTLGFGSQHPKGKPQPPTTPVPRVMTPSSGFSRSQAFMHFHTCGATIHMHKIKVSLKKTKHVFQSWTESSEVKSTTYSDHEVPVWISM